MLAAVTATMRLWRDEGGLARRDGLTIHFAAGAVIVVVISAQNLVDTFAGGTRPDHDSPAPTVSAPLSSNGDGPRADMAPGKPSSGAQDMHDEIVPLGAVVSLADSNSAEQPLAASGDEP